MGKNANNRSTDSGFIFSLIGGFLIAVFVDRHESINWHSPFTYAFIVIGVSLFVIGVVMMIQARRGVPLGKESPEDSLRQAQLPKPSKVRTGTAGTVFMVIGFLSVALAFLGSPNSISLAGPIFVGVIGLTFIVVGIISLISASVSSRESRTAISAKKPSEMMANHPAAIHAAHSTAPQKTKRRSGFFWFYRIALSLPIVLYIAWGLIARWTHCSGFDPCVHWTGGLTSAVGTYALLSFLLWPVCLVVLIAQPYIERSESENK